MPLHCLDANTLCIRLYLYTVGRRIQLNMLGRLLQTLLVTVSKLARPFLARSLDHLFDRIQTCPRG